MATGRMGHHRRVCLALEQALASERSRVVQRNRAFIAVVAWAGYSAIVGLGTVPGLDGCAQEDWDVLVPAAALILERLVEDAFEPGRKAEHEGGVMTREQFEARRAGRRSVHKLWAVILIATTVIGGSMDYTLRDSTVTFWGALCTLGLQGVVFLIYEARDLIQGQVIGR